MTVENPRKKPRGAFEIRYAGSYEDLSDATRAYEKFSKTLAELLGAFRSDAREVCEVGSGTGNSATVILESNLSINHLYGIEPGDFVWLADAKQKSNAGKFFLPSAAPDYSLEMAQRMQAHKDRFHIIKARGEQLPLASGSMDAVLMCQVFHWLKSDKALNEFHRILKPEGVLVFDESGTQFDFGESPEGKKLKSVHITKHPMSVLFQEELSRQLEKRKTLSTMRPSEYLFTLDSIRALLEQHGFRLLTDEKGNAYKTTVVEYSDDLIPGILKNVAKMRIAVQAPQILDTPLLADEIISVTLQEAKRQWENLPNEERGRESTYADTQAAFVAQKI